MREERGGEEGRRDGDSICPQGTCEPAQAAVPPACRVSEDEEVRKWSSGEATKVGASLPACINPQPGWDQHGAIGMADGEAGEEIEQLQAECAEGKQWVAQKRTWSNQTAGPPFGPKASFGCGLMKLSAQLMPCAA